MTDEITLLLHHIDRVARAGRTKPVKLTREHWEAVKAARPPKPTPAWEVGGQIGDIFATPVILVDDYTDSTPHIEHWLELPGPLRTPVTVDTSSREYQRLVRRWHWATKLSPDMTVLHADGTRTVYRGRMPWWRRAYIRVRMWLA